MAGDGCRARGRPDEADEHAQGRGLSRSVGTEEAIDLATPHAHVNGVDGEDPTAISLGETVGLDDGGVFHGHHARFRLRPRRQPREGTFTSPLRMRWRATAAVHVHPAMIAMRWMIPVGALAQVPLCSMSDAAIPSTKNTRITTPTRME